MTNPIDATARGAALLDAAVPNWRDKINVDILDVESIFTCILGQLFGSYNNGLTQLDFGLDEATEYGFSASDYYVDMLRDEDGELDYFSAEKAAFEELNAAWKSRILSGLEN